MTNTTTTATVNPDTTVDSRPAMRTPAYLVLSLLGVAVAALAWAPWHGVAPVGQPGLGLVDTFAGVDIDGWGTAAVVGGVALALLGILGYFWNPFSDPEAVFIALISTLVLVGAIYRIFDVRGWSFEPVEFDGTYQVATGLWLLALAAALSLIGSLLIVVTRGRADR